MNYWRGKEKKQEKTRKKQEEKGKKNGYYFTFIRTFSMLESLRQGIRK